MGNQSDTYTDGTERCETDGCYRKADYVATFDQDAEGNILDETAKRGVCGPCKNAAQYYEAWATSDFSFRPLQPGTEGDHDV